MIFSLFTNVLSIIFFVLPFSQSLINKSNLKDNKKNIFTINNNNTFIANKVIWVIAIVFILTLILLIILKISIELANESKIEMLKMKDAYYRVITEQVLQSNKNSKLLINKEIK